MDLIVSFLPDYPNIPPLIKLDNPIPFTPLSSSLVRLEKELLAVANDNLGIPMIFTLVCSLQELLLQEEQIVERQKKEKEEMERQKEFDRIAASNISDKMPEFPTYTPFSKEAFIKWKTAFDNERLKLKEEMEKKNGSMGSGVTGSSKKLNNSLRPTGRQLFEADTSLMASDANFEEDGVDIDVALFEDLEDLEIESENESENDEDDCEGN